jgi:hypothetical protein
MVGVVKPGSQRPVVLSLQMYAALQRLLMVCDSPGGRMAANWSIELLTGRAVQNRPVIVRTSRPIEFVISVTILSREMNHVLLRRHRGGERLPRQALHDTTDWIADVARSIAWDVTGDSGVEIALMGRALAAELWDDDPQAIKIGLNFLAIARGLAVAPSGSPWSFEDFAALDLNTMDPREALALSEMLAIMGVANPYDPQAGEENSLEPTILPAA